MIVPCEHYEILPREDVRRLGWMRLEQPHTIGIHFHVGDDGAGEPTCYYGYRAFHGFVRPHEVRGSATLQRQTLHERHIQLGTHTK